MAWTQLDPRDGQTTVEVDLSGVGEREGEPGIYDLRRAIVLFKNQ